jgi:hypothetical protein
MERSGPRPREIPLQKNRGKEGFLVAALLEMTGYRVFFASSEVRGFHCSKRQVLTQTLSQVKLRDTNVGPEGSDPRKATNEFFSQETSWCAIMGSARLFFAVD